MINIKILELKNFLSHVDTHIVFDDYKGLVLIEGRTSDGHYSSNGAGKSTILEGIYYALTGDTLRGIGVNDVVNRNYKKNTRVSLSFYINEDLYTIDRYRKDDIHGDDIIFYHGTEDISKRLNKDTQALIDSIVNIPRNILVSTMLLGEGLSSRFTQLSDPEKKNLIESTMNLQYDLNKSRDVAKTKLKDLKLDLSRVQGELSILQELSDISVEELEDNIKDLESHRLFLGEKSKEIEKDVEDISAEKDSIQPKISLLKESMTKYNQITSGIEKCDKEMSELHMMQSHIRNQSDSICPVCHQSLSTKESRDSTIQHYQDRISELLGMIESLSYEKQELPEYSIMNDKILELQNRYTSLNNRLTELSSLSNQYLSERVKCTNDIEYMKKEISTIMSRDESISDKNREISEIQKSIDKYEYLSDLFSPAGIIVSILEEAISYINNRLSTYSEILLEKDYKIVFNKGKISLLDTKGSNYQSLSNGEKRRLDIAIQFSLHDYVQMYCGMRLNTCFIDEVLDTLDDIGVENIFDVLRLKLDYCNLNSIYIISHNNSLKSRFDRSITITKDIKGDSFIS